MPPVSIRPLVPDDAAAFRDLRLQALRDHPDAFGAAFEEESERPPEWFADRLASGFVLGGGTRAERLDGIAGVFLPKHRKARHKAHPWGMYVRPEARGSGLGRALIQGCIDHARGLAEEIVLGVGTHNVAALALYRSMGFAECGFEQRSIRAGGRTYDEILMAVRFLRPRSRPSTERRRPRLVSAGNS